MSRSFHKANNKKEGESFSSVTETALGSLLRKALDEGDYDRAGHLSEVGTVGPYELIPHDDIHDMKKKEGRLQAVGVGMAAEANIPHGLSLARRLANFTQSDAAEIVGITPLSLSRYETGERTPSIGMLVALASLYGTHVERLLGIIDEQRERLLDAYDFATPTARATILEVAEGIQAGRSPEARAYAASDTQRLKEHHASQMKRHRDQIQNWLTEVYEQEQDGRGLSRYTDGMIERCQTDELRQTMIRLRDEGANDLTEDELDHYLTVLEDLDRRLSDSKKD